MLFTAATISVLSAEASPSSALQQGVLHGMDLSSQ
jgi:hypothetical protein